MLDFVFFILILFFRLFQSSLLFFIFHLFLLEFFLFFFFIVFAHLEIIQGGECFQQSFYESFDVIYQQNLNCEALHYSFETRSCYFFSGCLPEASLECPLLIFLIELSILIYFFELHFIVQMLYFHITHFD